MSHGREFDQQAVYQIRVKGNLDQKWSAWFDGLTITPQANDETMLIGLVADQTALHGLLAKIRDLGLPLVSVNRLAPELAETLNSPGGEQRSPIIHRSER